MIFSFFFGLEKCYLLISWATPSTMTTTLFWLQHIQVHKYKLHQYFCNCAKLHWAGRQRAEDEVTQTLSNWISVKKTHPPVTQKHREKVIKGGWMRSFAWENVLCAVHTVNDVLHNTRLFIVTRLYKKHIYFLSISHKHLSVSLVTCDADEQKWDERIHGDNLPMVVV